MLNLIIIQGRLTRDPELRYTKANNAVANFTVAVDRDYQPKEGDRQTDFIDVVAWNKLGEFVCRNWAKGKPVIVVGKLELRKWTDKDGNKRTSAEINASNVYFELHQALSGVTEKITDGIMSEFTEEPDDAVLPF